MLVRAEKARKSVLPPYFAQIGLPLVQGQARIMAEFDEWLCAGFTEEELEQFYRGLEKICNNLDERCGPSSKQRQLLISSVPLPLQLLRPGPQKLCGPLPV